MQRRQFIKCLSALGAVGALPGAAIAMTQPVNIKQAFNQALAQDVTFLGLQSMEGDFAPKTLSVEGTLPKDLQGMLVRNGPAKFERQQVRYKHWFEGDGMIQQFILGEGKVRHQGRFVRTPKFVEEEQAGRFLYSGPDTKIADGKPVSSAGHINVANTNVIPVNDELWALWEAGSATAIDSASLDFKQQVNLGAGSKYGDQLKGLPFSAHPKIDPNGDIWNFGLSPRGDVVLYHLSSKGQLKNLSVVDAGYQGGMLHDFLITEKHVLIILPSLRRRRNAPGYFAGTYFDNELPIQALVVDKNTLKVRRKYELPSGFVFHFGNAWEDKQGNMRFDASVYRDVSVLHNFQKLMSGNSNFATSNAYTRVYTLYKDGGVKHSKFEWSSEFPRVCAHKTGVKNTLLFHVSGQDDAIWSHAVVARNMQTGEADLYDYGQEYVAEEHIPVCPNPSKEKGYLLGTALHLPSKRTCLNVFNMENIADGPIARAWLPYHLPLGFHGNFVA